MYFTDVHAWSTHAEIDAEALLDGDDDHPHAIHPPQH
jgi:hypothetical protein